MVVRQITQSLNNNYYYSLCQTTKLNNKITHYRERPKSGWEAIEYIGSSESPPPSAVPFRSIIHVIYLYMTITITIYICIYTYNICIYIYIYMQFH